MLKHTGENPFRCIIFNAEFTTSGNVNTHTGEKPFNCTICNAEFSLRGNLKSYMLKHTEENPFK